MAYDYRLVEREYRSRVNNYGKKMPIQTAIGIFDNTLRFLRADSPELVELSENFSERLRLISIVNPRELSQKEIFEIFDSSIKDLESCEERSADDLIRKIERNKEQKPIQSKTETIEDVIREVSSNQKYVHYCFGKALSMDFTAFPYKGNLSFHPDIFCSPASRELFYKKNKRFPLDRDDLLDREEVWKDSKSLDDYDGINHQFEAMIKGSFIGGSYAFRLYYPENNLDNRPGCFTSYALLIPKDKISKARIISQNPDSLIKLFQKIFPQYDNGKERLKIRYDYPNSIDIKF
ncbi:MAG: hypothetical protein ACOYT4_04400 [Nanoarchaeota archaeon]